MRGGDELPAAVPVQGLQKPSRNSPVLWGPHPGAGEARFCPPIKGGLAKKGLAPLAEENRGLPAGLRGGVWKARGSQPGSRAPSTPAVAPGRRRSALAVPSPRQPQQRRLRARPLRAPGAAVTSRPARSIHHFLPAGGSTRREPRSPRCPRQLGDPGWQWPAWPPRTPTCRAWPGGPACSTPRSRGRGNLVLEL